MHTRLDPGLPSPVDAGADSRGGAPPPHASRRRRAVSAAAPPPSATEAAADDARWAAVAARDAAADARFVYAVTTTGIFCRASCPSRRPRRAHVRFFATPDAAARAGFRACRRCRPDGAPTAGAEAVARARAYLDACVAEREGPVPLAELAAAAGMSAHHLQRCFTRQLGVSPRAYLAALRADRLKQALRAHPTVTRAAFEAGYGASSRAYAAGAAHLGMTPAAYRRGGAGVAIRWATAATPIGRVLVAATARGICAVTLGDDDAALARALAGEYPNAERTHLAGAALADDPALGGWLAAVVASVAGESVREPSEEAMPVDVAGTPFQARVWEALRAIPRGETRSYAEVAAAIGAPRAVRAVAGACAANRVALVVPCHRVVAATGDVGGYRWGAERKRALLAAERRAADGPAAAR